MLAKKHWAAPAVLLVFELWYALTSLTSSALDWMRVSDPAGYAYVQLSVALTIVVLSAVGIVARAEDPGRRLLGLVGILGMVKLIGAVVYMSEV